MGGATKMGSCGFMGPKIYFACAKPLPSDYEATDDVSSNFFFLFLPGGILPIEVIEAFLFPGGFAFLIVALFFFQQLGSACTEDQFVHCAEFIVRIGLAITCGLIMDALLTLCLVIVKQEVGDQHNEYEAKMPKAIQTRVILL